MVPDFSWGFQPNLSSGTRSSTLRVLAISISNSGRKLSAIDIRASIGLGQDGKHTLFVRQVSTPGKSAHGDAEDPPDRRGRRHGQDSSDGHSHRGTTERCAAEM